MSLYYEDDQIRLFHGDCLTETTWLEADVLCCDPPYGMAFQSNQRKGPKMAAIAGDQDAAVRDAALELWGPTRPALVFGRWSVRPPLYERLRLIWWKEGNPGMGDLAMPWGPAHEDIHLLGSGWDREATGLKRSGSVIPTRGVRGGSSGEENATGHPTPKPVGLMEYLLQRCPRGVIADPFAGSGATLLAAKNQGRRAIGVELEERYCEVIAKRLTQDTLFGGAA